jgi:hypothetical protein
MPTYPHRHRDRLLAWKKEKKGNYPRSQDKPQFLGFILKRLVIIFGIVLVMSTK